MGLCCSVEVVDGDALKRSYPPEITPELPDMPDEGKQEAPQDAVRHSEAPWVPHTANVEALKRARAARGSMAIIAFPSASPERV